MTSAPTFGAILLAGGRASRMGGIAKPLLEVGGASLLAHAIHAARDAGSSPLTVVGPEAPALAAADVTWVREDPPFTGPAAAVVAALASWAAAVDPSVTLVLACDLPRVRAASAQLARDILLVPSDTDGLCLADASGRPQWLIGAYRTARLRDAAARLPNRGENASIRALLDDLAIAVVADASGAAADVDTWEDLKRFTDPAPPDPPRSTKETT
ncbi:molybdenum cofactor guanylyltransferase [Microbacterium sp.]|uniref:molybdenum cofactor guanylyltransferase n=1 Tax=Microbacterium sp. TaxID=51671 RepID=UPI001AD361FD|nr:NTP transferase domain-containing protein [Microbacterium sp.]MBN9188847.1 NTP transferase domain-containing protein [Microbacterium sp.]MBN9193455.1 NTP transferase domain-containing protein [Microbacterium sp.]